MEIQKEINPLGLKKCENADRLSRAERPLSTDGQGFYKKGKTIFSTADVYERKYGKNQKGEDIIGTVYLTMLFDEKNQFVKAGTVAVNAFGREICPEKGSAIGAVPLVKGIDQYNSSKDFVNNYQTKCIVCGEKINGGFPRWDEARGEMNYDNMVIREQTQFEIADIPEEIKEYMRDIWK